MKKKWMRFVVAALIIVLTLGLLQRILMPKYATGIVEGALISEYYDEVFDHDVIFIGDCEVYETYSPVTLWEEYGIPSWVRGSAQQTVWQSYYLLEEMLRYETPKVVVFNVLAMKYDTPESTGSDTRREAYNRMTLDGMKWSQSKWRAISASMTEKEEGMLTYLFPILRFHDRWRELSREDFKYLFRREAVSHNGYLMRTLVVPFEGGLPEAPPRQFSFGENSWYYLNQMETLCRERGIRLVLVKAPNPMPVWWESWEQAIRDYAEEKGLLYLNAQAYQEEIGIDWTRDTYDGGYHLNVYGAEKTTRWLGEILLQRCGLPDRRGEQETAALWAEKTARYEKDKQEAGT